MRAKWMGWASCLGLLALVSGMAGLATSADQP
jgi:hypothetical protein